MTMLAAMDRWHWGKEKGKKNVAKEQRENSLSNSFLLRRKTKIVAALTCSKTFIIDIGVKDILTCPR